MFVPACWGRSSDDGYPTDKVDTKTGVVVTKYYAKTSNNHFDILFWRIFMPFFWIQDSWVKECSSTIYKKHVATQKIGIKPRKDKN